MDTVLCGWSQSMLRVFARVLAVVGVLLVVLVRDQRKLARPEKGRHTCCERISLSEGHPQRSQ